MPLFTPEQEITNVVPVTGPLTDTELRATPVPVSGTITANAGTGPFPVSDNGGSLTVDGSVSITGTVATTVGGSSTATVTSVSVSPTVATLSASNAAKTKVIIHNEGGTLFVKLGSAASSTSYSYRLTANATVEISGYTGIITATKASGTSNALVTEVGI